MNAFASDSTSTSGLPIAAVERETGLSKDTLRVWEKRYGFPQPLRDSAGDRLYPSDQVEQLVLISRLLASGMRPSKVVGLDLSALQALLVPGTSAMPATVMPARPLQGAETTVPLEDWLVAIAAHDQVSLRHQLAQAQLRMGLAAFVTDLVVPLTIAVGESWAQGRFQVFEEHLYTETISVVLRQAIATLPPPLRSQGPKVLLTTLPQEMHSLGLLMVEAMLVLEGCHCVSLGTQTPLTDVVQAARAHRVDVVGLSFTNNQPGAVVKASLRELRQRLPRDTALWVGGNSAALYQSPIDGIVAMPSLHGLRDALQNWRNGSRPHSG